MASQEIGLSPFYPASELHAAFVLIVIVVFSISCLADCFLNSFFLCLTLLTRQKSKRVTSPRTTCCIRRNYKRHSCAVNEGRRTIEAQRWSTSFWILSAVRGRNSYRVREKVPVGLLLSRSHSGRNEKWWQHPS